MLFVGGTLQPFKIFYVRSNQISVIQESVLFSDSFLDTIDIAPVNLDRSTGEVFTALVAVYLKTNKFDLAEVEDLLTAVGGRTLADRPRYLR